jgi:hypothetical protein
MINGFSDENVSPFQHGRRGVEKKLTIQLRCSKLPSFTAIKAASPELCARTPL